MLHPSFTCNANGAPMTVTYGGTTYYYATNLQGDVIAILNSAGTKVVSYTYDAWGNSINGANSMASTLGTLNPLRYRGYVYDHETGLYYLQSRYYNPKLGRFISADALVSTGQGLLGNNMFAYCNNNPLIYADPTGAIPFSDGFYDESYREFGNWLYEIFMTDPEERDASGNRTTNATIKKILCLLLENVEFSAGIGQGYYLEGNILDVFSAACGMYGNYACIQYSDGQWEYGQEMNISGSIAFTQLLEFGFSEYSFMQNGMIAYENVWRGMNNTKETWVIFSAAAYFMIGGSVTISFDWNSFLEGLSKL